MVVARRRERVSGPFLSTAATAGVVVGHAAVYLVAFPDAASRSATLADTGHSYWATAVAIAIACASVSFIGLLIRHLGRGMRHERALEPWESYRFAAMRLAGLQSAVFIVQEVVERLLAGAPLSGLLHEGFIAIGIAIQIVVAAVLALIIVLLGDTAEALGRVLSRPREVRPPAVRAPRPSASPFLEGIDPRTRWTRAPPRIPRLGHT